MWQRFTERARRVILLGQEEAGKMRSSHVGTEHLLLGLVREDEGVAAQVLGKMGVGIAQVREEVASQTEPDSDFAVAPEPKLTPKAKRILELAADEARRMRHNYIGTEHLLLALLREKDGLAAKVLRKLGLDLETARSQVLEYLGPDAASAEYMRHSSRAAAEDALSPIASVMDDMDAPWAVPASDARRHQAEDAMLIEVLRQMQAHEERQAAYDQMLLRLLRRMLTQSSAATTLLAECGLDIEAARERIQQLLDEQK